ncbi:helix-turn-helix transcriptional regulator [Sphingomonas yantingensis]|uniref:Putative DNA-binding transcriptional regulator AlpA n=1 Tax=Sphingomonas yantingensis TaxID=1241761 RepID=A0A7W9AT02_9SPHN|nr:AlpA family phage regulatory protein [Sphingomonas yantingensis]MBB5700038.1 putative DNA-binding transcriptional regulator AlpA [Sphingomonas yantingensis]
MIAVAVQPWCPYTAETFPRSHGRVSLAEVLTTYTLLQDGTGAPQIAEAFGDPGDERVRGVVAASIRLLGRQLLEGRMKAYARPIGGGEPVAIPAGAWELDDFVLRFATCAIDPRRPFDATATPTHSIFVDDAAIDAIYGLFAPEGLSRPRAQRAPANPSNDAPPESPDARSAPELNRFLRLDEVERIVGIKRSTIYDRIRDERFPPQIDPGSRPALWRESDVRAWLADPR